MIEHPESSAVDDSPSPPEDTIPGVENTTWDGPALKAAREKSGLSIRELSSRTKINISILRALEEERFEDAPKARVYVRGFVRCMAEEIGINPDAVINSYVPRWEAWFEQAGQQYLSVGSRD